MLPEEKNALSKKRLLNILGIQDAAYQALNFEAKFALLNTIKADAPTSTALPTHDTFPNFPAVANSHPESFQRDPSMPGGIIPIGEGDQGGLSI